METAVVLDRYSTFIESSVTDRFLKHKDVIRLLADLPSEFEVGLQGNSVENRSISLIKWGSGPTRIFIWSQMHGDEATGTMAILDLFNFLQQEQFSDDVNLLKESCTLYMLPMVNPDGAERFTRRNAQQIDINRDYLQTVSAEALLLKQCREDIDPHFGFNLHDQTTLWSVKHNQKPATLSFLAPALDESLSINETRERAMLVIADIFKAIDPILPGHIGLFNDEYEPRAFGDNFQKEGTATILIEAGGLAGDPEKQQIRKYYFLSILSGLRSIAKRTYLEQQTSNYFCIPKNDKQIFHILIHQVLLNGTWVSIGINYDELPNENGSSTRKCYTIQDIGDLSYCHGYEMHSLGSYTIEGTIIFNANANFRLLDGNQIILSFSNGILL
ncbi:M14 family zinc carboxypeptidase [Pedobacter metabolipauper]|uniref:Zinc carboxypeptidase n=1 Tax=Pedobacter metabolipauper TaxID=425513 RepID=A0A4R6T0K4_9SPHI|nr:M14 family zinc carboxypeptidase [Pedobacter metabolipauper]TDQ11108.1 zinc carboxypeptidase [Pedobacter metabolipauper]